MGVQTITKNIFSSGEVAQENYARFDRDQYVGGMKTLKNFIVHPNGGIFNRPGTEYINGVKGAGGAVRLIPFTYSNADTYVLEFGAAYIRFYKDGAIVESGGSPYEVVTTFAAADLDGIQYAQSGDTIFLVHPDYKPQKLLRSSDTSWTLSDYDYDNGPFMPLNTDATELINPSATTGNITLTATSNIFSNITGSDHASNKTLWQINHIIPSQIAVDAYSATGNGTSVQCGGTWRVVTHGTWVGTIKIEISIDGGSTWSEVRCLASAGSENYNTYGTEDYPQFLVRSKCTAYTSGTATVDVSTDAFVWKGVVQITAVPSGGGGASQMYASADATVLTTLGSSNQTSDWAEGSWSNYRGYPSAITFHQDRLIFANTESERQTIWMTQTGIYNDFFVNSPVVDSDGISIILQERQINGINALVSLKDLLVLTDAGEWTVYSDSGGITPTNIQAKINSNEGCASGDTVVIGERALYIQARRSSLRDTGYSQELGGFAGNNLSIFSKHLLSQYTISELAYQKIPFGIVWMVRSDGSLLSLTYEHNLGVNGWSLHDTEGTFESVCTVPGETEDEVWFVVLRGTNRYVERLTTMVNSGTPEDQFYVDCGTAWDGDEIEIESMTNADPAVFTATAHGLSDTDIVRLDGVVGSGTDIAGKSRLEDINDQCYEVYDSTANTFKLKTVVLPGNPWSQENLDTSDMLAYVSGGTITTTTASVTGLSRFNGETVSLLVDGIADTGDVSSGSISVGGIYQAGYGSIIRVGYGYNCDAEILPINVVGNVSFFGKKINIPEIRLWLVDSLGGQVGPDSSNLQNLVWEEGFMAAVLYQGTTEYKFGYEYPLLVVNYLGNPYKHDLFSGVATRSIDCEVKENRTVFVRQNKPLPMNILAIMVDVSI